MLNGLWGLLGLLGLLGLHLLNLFGRGILKLLSIWINVLREGLLGLLSIGQYLDQ